jgi:hypothetical protein
MRSLLDPTGNDAVERAAIACPERPGTWCGDLGGDGRLLTQEETDYLIRRELLDIVDAAGRADLRRAIGNVPRVIIPVPPNWLASRQRGGIDSDPLVRLLAHRAWGDRDRCWFDRHGVRRDDPIIVSACSEVARAWQAEDVHGIATHDAHPGAPAEVVVNLEMVLCWPGDSRPDHQRRVVIRGLWSFRVGERSRVDAGGAPASTREVNQRYHLYCICTRHDFDGLHFERARLHDGSAAQATMTAHRAVHSTQVHVEEADVAHLFGYKSSDVFQRYCEALARELDRFRPRRPGRGRYPIR